MWIEGGAQVRGSDSESGPLWSAPEASVFEDHAASVQVQQVAERQIVENGEFFGENASGEAGLENRCHSCARRSDRPKRRTVALRASV
jgi:hypothetical protein